MDEEGNFFYTTQAAVQEARKALRPYVEYARANDTPKRKSADELIADYMKLFGNEIDK